MEKELRQKSIIGSWVCNPLFTTYKLEIDGCPHILSSSLFNKTMYLVYNGVLRQFRIKKAYIFPFTCQYVNEDYIGGIHCVYLMDIAGIGELHVVGNFWGYAFDFNIYESIENYKKGVSIDLRGKYKYIDLDYMKKLYSKYCSIEMNKLYRYVWNGIAAEPILWNTNISLYIVYDGKKCSLPKELEDMSYEGYPSKEECEKDNTINVACFADSDEEEQEQEFEVSASIKIKDVDYDSARIKVLELVKNNLKDCEISIK